MQRIRAIGYTEGVPGADIGGELLFKACDLLPTKITTAFQDSRDSLIDLSPPYRVARMRARLGN